MTEKTTRTPRRLLPKLLLAAVIITLLASTAVAASTILNALKDGQTELQGGEWYAPTGSPYDEGPYDAYDVYIDVDISPEAPTSIENYYIPMLGDTYVAYLGASLNDATQFGWFNGANKEESSILFFQYAGGRFDTDDPVTRLTIPAGQEPQTQLVEMGGVSGYLIEDPTSHGERHFYWSDGDYVFQLTVPDEYTDAQLEALVKSVRYVPSIEPYLVPEDVSESIISGRSE